MGSKSSRTEGRGSRRQPAKTAAAGLAVSPETVLVARVLRPHGLKGEVAVAVLSDVPGRLDPGSECLLVRRGEAAVAVRIASRRPLGKAVAIALAGFAGRDAAEELRGATLEVPTSRVPPAPPGSYWMHELLGCGAVDVRQGDLGVVVELVEHGGGWLLSIEGDRKLLVPFVAEFLRGVDVGARRIELELPEGLIEACASR